MRSLGLFAGCIHTDGMCQSVVVGAINLYGSNCNEVRGVLNET